MNDKNLRRVFLGDNSPLASNFEKKHLKGYLTGNKLFQRGFHMDRKPMYYEVKVAWMTDEEYYKYIGLV